MNLGFKSTRVYTICKLYRKTVGTMTVKSTREVLKSLCSTRSPPSYSRLIADLRRTTVVSTSFFDKVPNIKDKPRMRFNFSMEEVINRLWRHSSESMQYECNPK